jgi:superfamily I DNA/RNA helicase
MTIFVYITDTCREQAKIHHINHALDKLAADIEREQAFWRLDSFPYPFWVKKRLGNRHSRLICRLETHQIQGQAQDVLVCLNIFQRGDSQYDKIYWQMVEKGEELYKRVVNVQILKNWLITRCTQHECPSLPPPSLEESDYLYAVRSQQAYIDHGHTKNLIYEAWSWVEYGLSHCSRETLTTIAQRLADWTLQSVHNPVAYTLAEVPPYRIVIQPFSAHQVSFLTIEPLSPQDKSTKLSERHLTLATLQHESDQLDDHAFLQLLARASRRVYPQDLSCEPTDWLAVQHNYAANLAFSPEESDILHFTQQQERPFPLFINGRAGSGKSTILQYLFADYLQHAHQQHIAAETALYPVYFTCNQTLTDRAAEIISQIVHHSSHGNKHAIDLSLIKKHCLEFRGFLLQLLPATEKTAFSRDKWIDYGRFRRLWEQKFGHNQEATRKYPASLCWHVIRSYIKGLDADNLLEPNEYLELAAEKRTLDQILYQQIYHKVWEKWYQPLCKDEQYWDDQDLARYVLGHEWVTARFPAIFCDESQDFTRIEMHIILRLNLFSARLLRPDEIQRVPLVFAGDQFQTLNPTGFRWESIKAQVVEQFIFALDPAKHATLSDINYRELGYNFRSTQNIARFSNIIHGLRAKLFNLKSLKPQQSWHQNDHSRAVVLIDTQDSTMSLQLSKQYDLVFILPCLDGQETDFIKNEPVLRQYLQLRDDGSTSIPAMSVIRAKGLEFQRVVLYGFAADRPADFDLSGQTLTSPEQQIHHEYFLNRLYVAITRARSQLLIIEEPKHAGKFWQHFLNAWQPPIALQQLPHAQEVWQAHLGAMRLARLNDITPDADQIRLMAENAEKLQQQGLDDQDVYLLRQAAGLYGQLGNSTQQNYCLAEILYIEENYPDAGYLFLAMGNTERAYASFWRAHHWPSLHDLIQSQKLPPLLQYTLASEAVMLRCKATTSLQPYLNIIQKLHLQDSLLPSHPHDQYAWQTLLGQIIEQLPLDKTDKKWPRLYEQLRQLAANPYFAKVIPPLLLAETAYLANNMSDACHFWELSKEQHKITPPFPRYAEAIVATRPFPANLDALVSLKEDKKLCQLFSDYQDIDQLSLKSWQLVLDSLFTTLSQPQVISLLNAKLLTLGNLAFLDTLIDQASACNYSKAWLKRLSKLRLLRACTEGDWTLVYDTLMVQVKTDSSPKNSKSANQLTTLTLSTETELILHGLSHSEPYSQMTEEDHASQAALDVMNALKAIFQVEIPNHARGKNAQTTPKLVSVWRTDFKSVRLLGAVLERSQLFSETLPFYEALEKIQPEYASRRWLACKLRQAEHSYKLRDYYQGRMSSSADSQRRQEYERKYREAEDRAEKYQNVARSQKRKLKLESYEDISAYPELLNLTDIIKTILKMDEPGKPTLPDATTAPVESANSLPPELEHSVTASPDEADTTADPDAVTLMTSPDPAQTEADNVEPAPADTGHDIVLATYTEPTDTDTAHENMCQPVLNSNSIKPSDSPDTLTKDSSVFNEEATLVADTSQTDTIVIDRASMADDITILHPEANKSVASVTRLPTTILYLLDYRLLIIRASCRLNIEHQLTGESVSVWLKNGRISGDWIIPNGLTTDAQLLSGTCLWIQRIADTTDCIISIPEQGIALRLNCG